MKIRSGFVSNSSSSSFIVAVNGVNTCPHCKRSDPNFLDFVGKFGNPNDYECTKMLTRGAEETIKWWKDNIGYEDAGVDHEQWDEIFEKIRVAEASGKEVGSFSIGYHDDDTNSEWYVQRRGNALEILWSDH